MNDSLKIGEYYTLVLYHKDFYEYLSYVDVNNDIVRTTTNPEQAIRFDKESDAKIFFFNRFGFFQHHYGINLVDVVVGKMAIKYELEICSVSPFKAGDKVKFLGLSEDEALVGSQFYPPVNTVGEVVEVLSPAFCFVQWPNGAIYSNGALSCPNCFLEKVTDEKVDEKVTEHWVPATKDNVKVGNKVRMIDGEIHNEKPQWFPAVGTVGIVRNLYYINCEVQWPKGTTSWRDKWWCNYEHLEVLL